MAIFQKGAPITGISDQMTLGGYTFDAQLKVCEKNGNKDAINHGRILFLQITCEDEVIAYFDDGIWYQLPDINFDEGVLAKDLFIMRWSKSEEIRKREAYDAEILAGTLENWITPKEGDNV